MNKPALSFSGRNALGATGRMARERERGLAWLPQGSRTEIPTMLCSELFRKGLPGTSMPAFSFGSLRTWELVTHLRALGFAQGAGQTKGNAQAGAAVFRANCSRCHTVSGEGGLSGPDLTTSAAQHSLANLRQSILNPDAQVDSEYWSVVATTASGPTIRGARLNEDTFSIQVRDENGRLLSLQKSGLKDVELIRRSPMPSFEGKLSETQIDDVIAYIVSIGRQQ